MDEYTYLVPANSKKQNLIFGFMLKTDLFIMIIALFLTFMFLFFISASTLIGVIIIILPIFIGGLLVFPIPNYHNVRIFIKDMYKYHMVYRKKYIWRGWCYNYEQRDE